MTPERLAEIRDRLRAATSGPWKMCDAREGACTCGLIWALPADAVVAIADSAGHSELKEGFTDEQARKNGEFIAHAPEDIADLLAAIDALTGKPVEAPTVPPAPVDATDGEEWRDE